MERPGTFMAYEMREKISRLMAPVRRLVFQRKGYLQCMKVHDGLHGYQCLRYDELGALSRDVPYTHPFFARSKRMFIDHWQGILLTIGYRGEKFRG